MATTITLRETKGSPLTFEEMDSNLSSIKNNKEEIISNLTSITSVDSSSDKIAVYDASEQTSRSILLSNVNPFIERSLIVKCVADAIAPYTGNGITHVTIPSSLNGKRLASANAHVYTVGSGGSITNIQIHNLTDAVDMLSTPITIDLNEKDSSTAATQPVVNSSTNLISTGDVIRIDVDAVATNTLGLEIRMVFNA